MVTYKNGVFFFQILYSSLINFISIVSSISKKEERKGERKGKEKREKNGFFLHLSCPLGRMLDPGEFKMGMQMH